MLQAQASGAQVIAINNGGDDAINAAKAAREFGLQAKGAKVVALGLDSLPAIKSAGLDVAQGGMYVTTWLSGPVSPEAQAFMKKFIERRKTAPSTFHVGTYSAVLNYLKSVQATNSKDSKTVIAHMRTQNFKDAFTTGGTLRPDGRMVHDVYLVQVKTPAESKSEWDLLKVVARIPGRAGVPPAVGRRLSGAQAVDGHARCGPRARKPRGRLFEIESLPAMNQPATDTILSMASVSKSFSGFLAVAGVSLDVRRGSIHALIGPNGAGKTTLFNLATKFLVPSGGRIVFKGRDITR